MVRMGRKRQSDLSLPPRMHVKGGCYYYVTSTVPRKWFKLHKDLPRARVLWAQIENGEGDKSALFNTRLDEYLVSARFTALADNTRRQYEYVANDLRDVFAGATLPDIAPTDIAIWLDNHKSAIQANTGKAIISSVFEVAVRHGLVNRNPCKEIKYLSVQGRDRLITDAEYRAIWNAADAHVQIAMDIGYLTGSRISDILAIKLQDISEEGIYIRQGKTKKRMLFLLSPALEEVLTRARSLPRPIRGMHMICNHSGQPYKYGTFNTHWLSAVRSTGIEELHFHDIRAKAATDAKNMGLDYQALLGHTTRAMSDKYIRLRDVQRVETLPAMKVKK